MPHPSSSSAYGIWSLNEVRDAERGENWPSSSPPEPALLTYTMSQSSVYSTNVAATYANMTDGNYLNTDASATNIASNSFIRCDFGSIKTVKWIKIAPAHAQLVGGWSNFYTEGETVRYSNDATNWTVAYTLPSSMPEGTLSETQVNFQARYVEVWAGIKNDYLALCEFQIEGFLTMATYPNTTSASDVWSLRDVYKAEAAGEWPSIPPITVDLTNVSYDSKSFSVNSQETAVQSFAVSTDGTKLYVLGYTNDTVYQYTLSTAYDISTASYASKSFDISSEDGTARELEFSPDGTKMYVTGNVLEVHEYALSTAWDVSTASLTSSTSVNFGSTLHYDIAFGSSGTKMYITNFTKEIRQYTLSTAFDSSSATYDSVNFTPTTNPSAVMFNTDGTKMYLQNVAQNNIVRYTLSTAYDISSASVDSGQTFDFSSQSSSPRNAQFSSDYKKLYTVDFTTLAIYQYSTGL